MTTAHDPELVFVRQQITALAERLSNPANSALVADLAQKLTPKPGPSKARLMSKAEQARRVRHLWRKFYSSESPANAARLLAESANSYHTRKWPHDVAAGRDTPTEPNATWRAMLDAGIKLPSDRTIRRWLARKAT